MLFDLRIECVISKIKLKRQWEVYFFFADPVSFSGLRETKDVDPMVIVFRIVSVPVFNYYVTVNHIYQTLVFILCDVFWDIAIKVLFDIKLGTMFILERNGFSILILDIIEDDIYVNNITTFKFNLSVFLWLFGKTMLI